MAVWDVIGQSAGLPVTELLGGCGDRLRWPTWSGSPSRPRWWPRPGGSVSCTASPRSRSRSGAGPLTWTSRPAARSGRRCGEEAGSTSTATAAGQRRNGPRAAGHGRASICSSPRSCPGRRRARPPLAGVPGHDPHVRRRECPHPGGPDPGTARRLGHRHQHQDRADRLHRVAPHPGPVRGAAGRRRARRPDRRPARLALRPGLRGRVRSHLPPGRRNCRTSWT